MCASVLCAMLVWLGITGCGLAYPAAGIALAGSSGNGGEPCTEEEAGCGAPDQAPFQNAPVYAFNSDPDAEVTLFRLEETGVEDGLGGITGRCEYRPLLFDTPVIDAVHASINFVEGGTSNRLYALTPTAGGSALIAVDADGFESSRVALPPGPVALDISGGTKTAYVVLADWRLAQVDLQARTVVIRPIPPGASATPVDVSVSASTVFLTADNGITYLYRLADLALMSSLQPAIDTDAGLSLPELESTRMVEPKIAYGFDANRPLLVEFSLPSLDAAGKDVLDLTVKMTLSAPDPGTVMLTDRLGVGETYGLYRALQPDGTWEKNLIKSFPAGFRPEKQLRKWVLGSDPSGELSGFCPDAVEPAHIGVRPGPGESRLEFLADTFLEDFEDAPPDDEDLPEVTIDDATVDESAGTVSVAVHLSKPAMDVVSVDYTIGTGDGTASPFDDFVPASGTLLFDGVTTRTIAVTVVNDDLNEIDENFSVDLSNPDGVTITDAHADVTIVNDDGGGLPSLSIHDAKLNESDETWFFDLELSEPADHGVSVDVTFMAGTATAADVDLITATVMLPAGDTATQFVFQPRNDKLYEPDEEFFAILSHPMGAVIADGQAVGTITSDDQQPRIAPIAGQVLVEGNATAPALVPVTLDAISGVDTTVTFAAVNGTAIAGVHFTVQTPSVVIPAGAIGGNLVLDIIGDTSDNPDRSFDLMVGAINAMVMSSVVSFTIADDDAAIPPGTIQVTVGTAPVDLEIFVDSVPYTAPPPFFWDPNSTHELRARGTVNLADRRYRFSQWSDGNAIATRNIVVVAPTQYVAFYNAEFRLTVNTTAGGTITIDPPSESGYYPAGEFVTVTAVPAPNFTAQFDGFDDLGGPNQAFVIMNSPRTVTVTFVQAPPGP